MSLNEDNVLGDESLFTIQAMFGSAVFSMIKETRRENLSEELKTAYTRLTKSISRKRENNRNYNDIHTSLKSIDHGKNFLV